MGGKLDFYNTPTEQRNVYSRLRFSEKINKKRLQNYDPKNIEDLSKSSKNYHVGGMSTETDNTDDMFLWDSHTFLGDDRQRKCLPVDL